MLNIQSLNMYSTMSPIEMPSTTSIESTSYTLKLNANSHKVFNHITNWTKISNAFHNQMPVAAPASAFAWPSSGESVAVRIGGISMEFAAVRGWLLAGTRVCCGRCRRTDVGMPCQRLIAAAVTAGTAIGVIAIGVSQSKFAEALDEIMICVQQKKLPARSSRITTLSCRFE